MASKESYTGKNVLVVDDEMMVSKFISELLKSRGCSVTTIEKSPEALEYFRDNHKTIDLVITDQTMPDMTGVELIQEMFGVAPDLNVFIATGYSEEVNEEIALSMGINAFLTKPIKSATLLEKVSAVFFADKAED